MLRIREAEAGLGAWAGSKREAAQLGLGTQAGRQAGGAAALGVFGKPHKSMAKISSVLRPGAGPAPPQFTFATTLPVAIILHFRHQSFMDQVA